MYDFSRYKIQYRENLKLALPVVMSQLGQVVVQIADNAMVGQYGGDDPTPLAAVSFGGALHFLSFVIVMGLTLGITPLIGELFAQKKVEESAKYLQNSIALFAVVSLVGMALQLAVVPLMGHMGQPEEVVAMAIPYYEMMALGLPPIILFFAVKQFLEGIGNTKVAMFCIILSNVLNIILNYMLIGGEWGAPELGAFGAGVATFAARVASVLLLFGYFFGTKQFSHYHKHFSRHNFSRPQMKRLLTFGFPISTQIFFEASCFSIIGLLSGLFGTNAISANQIALTAGHCSFMIVLAVGAATTIRISHSYGAQNFIEMRRASAAAVHLSLMWSITTATALLIFRHAIPKIFTTNTEVIETTSTLLLVIAAYQILDSLQCIGVGILRGMQDVKIIPYISFSAYWLSNIPIACFCAFILDMGLEGLYMGYVTGFAVAAVLIYFRIRRRQRWLAYNKWV
ncbi:MAG: MATE family efflux transporter [Rikenellaceae bacterium]